MYDMLRLMETAEIITAVFQEGFDEYCMDIVLTGSSRSYDQSTACEKVDHRRRTPSVKSAEVLGLKIKDHITKTQIVYEIEPDSVPRQTPQRPCARQRG